MSGGAIPACHDLKARVAATVTRRSAAFAQVLGSADLLEILLLSRHQDGLNHALTTTSIQDGQEIAYTEDGLMQAGTVLIVAGLLGVFPDNTLRPTVHGEWLLHTAVDEHGKPRA